MKTVELNGKKYKVDEDKLDDWDFMKMLCNLKENPLELVKVGNFLLGEEQNKKLEESFRKDGKIKTSEMMQAYTDLLEQLKVKN